MEDIDNLYEVYAQYVDDEFSKGSFEELHEDGFSELVHKNERETRYRILTKKEFVDRKIYEKNNHFKG